jgi:hypothetical protein
MNVSHANLHVSSQTLQSSPDTPRQPRSARDFACIVERAGRPVVFADRRKERAAKKTLNTTLRCECRHAKSIHARMYANPKLGTSCNYPGCRCKAYKAGSSAKIAKSKR